LKGILALSVKALSWIDILAIMNSP